MSRMRRILQDARIQRSVVEMSRILPHGEPTGQLFASLELFDCQLAKVFGKAA